MLDRLLDLKSALRMMVHDGKFETNGNQDKVLTNEDWSMVDQLRTVLKPLKQIQCLLEGQKYVTISIIPVVVKMAHDALDNLDPDATDEKDYDEQCNFGLSWKLVCCIREMISQWEDRFVGQNRRHDAPFQATVERGHMKRQVGLHPAIWIAHALDPRFKNTIQLRIGCLVNRKLLWQTIEDLMVSQCQKDDRESQTTAQAKPTATKEAVTDIQETPHSPLVVKRRSGKQLNSPDHFKFLLNQASGDRDADESLPAPLEMDIRDRCRNQLLIYRRARPIEFYTERTFADDIGRKWTENVFNDPLAWWRENYSQFPLVWNVARTYLAIPATSAPSERAFSVGGCAVSQKRCQLNAGLVEDLNLVHDNIDLLPPITSSPDQKGRKRAFGE